MTPKISTITQKVLSDPKEVKKLDEYFNSKDSSITFKIDGEDYKLKKVDEPNKEKAKTEK